MYKDWQEDKAFLKKALPVIFAIPMIYIILVILFSFADQEVIQNENTI